MYLARLILKVVDTNNSHPPTSFSKTNKNNSPPHHAPTL
jgi:hypothetical protein